MSPRFTRHTHSGHIADIDPIVAPLTALLGQLEWVLRRVNDGDYTVQRATGISGSIGSHVRHSLDHVTALTAGAEAGRIDYDHRRRGTAVESCRATALLEIDRTARDLRTLTSSDLDRSLELVAAIDQDGTRLSAATSVGRELAFVISHTIHHLAVIALLLRDLGIEVPPRFGYAPSTPMQNPTAA
jgi:uncharacterized damage-inducible protein DinB